MGEYEGVETEETYPGPPTGYLFLEPKLLCLDYIFSKQDGNLVTPDLFYCFPVLFIYLQEQTQ